MFDILKECTPKDTIALTDQESQDFTGKETHHIHSITRYNHEEGELVVLDLDGYYLIAHTFDGTSKSFLYEKNAEGYLEDLDDSAFTLGDIEDSLPNKVIWTHPNGRVVYRSILGPVHNLIQEDDASAEVFCCEYKSKDKFMTHIFVEKVNDYFNIYQGFKIPEKHIAITK